MRSKDSNRWTALLRDGIAGVVLGMLHLAASQVCGSCKDSAGAKVLPERQSVDPAVLRLDGPLGPCCEGAALADAAIQVTEGPAVSLGLQVETHVLARLALRTCHLQAVVRTRGSHKRFN